MLPGGLASGSLLAQAVGHSLSGCQRSGRRISPLGWQGGSIWGVGGDWEQGLHATHPVQSAGDCCADEGADWAGKGLVTA